MCITSASKVFVPEAEPNGVTDQAEAKQELCRFLAGCYCEPGPEFAEERLFESILAAAQRIDPELAQPAQRLGQAFTAATPQDLLVDYTRLFLGGAAGASQALRVGGCGGTAHGLPHRPPWPLARAFVLAVHDHAQSEFYRELAELTELFVRLEGQKQGTVTRH